LRDAVEVDIELLGQLSDGLMSLSAAIATLALKALE